MTGFIDDTRAGITVPMALLTAMVLVMVGLAIDGSRAFLARDKFQAALDAAALAIGTTYDNDSALDILAADFVARNFEMSGTQINRVDVTANSEFVFVEGNFNLDTYFVQLFALDTLTLKAETQVKRAGGGLMVSLVLDNTGSMWSSGNIVALRDASQALVDSVFDGKTDEPDLRFSVVPYAAAVNPGTVADDIISLPRAHGLSNGANETAWKGCVMERAGANSLDDTPPSTARWEPYYYPSGEDNVYTDGDAASIVPGGVKNSNQITGPNIGCPTPIQPLTQFKTQVDSALTSMTAWNRGGTLTDIGLAWGIRVLSPGLPFSESATHTDDENGLPLWS
ncbi:MAG: pilus assembly protein TadG-related protein, partial [Pseudomonadota bacterium]